MYLPKIQDILLSLKSASDLLIEISRKKYNENLLALLISASKRPSIPTFQAKNAKSELQKGLSYLVHRETKGKKQDETFNRRLKIDYVFLY